MVNLVATDQDQTVVRDFPHKVRVIDHMPVPVGDGVTLSAKIWLPEDAEDNPVPAIVEYAPFRHGDFTYPRDRLIHPWFAGNGYAAVRLELCGAGDSTGLPMDEYVAREQDDALAALDWISRQPWSSGRTGMMGMSWGAFSALQVAARRPPSLGAVIVVHGTDDRFRDDVHFMGGAMLYNNLSWGAQYFTYTARPPLPWVTGEGWRDRWKERIENAPFVLRDWAGHQFRNDYWRHASVAEDYGAIQCPVYVIGGWADGYAAAAMRMAAGLRVPRRVVVGPWAHTYPHIARPGPRIGFLQDATRWWDRWLKDVPNGIDAERPIWLWLRGAAPPAQDYEERSGRWISFAQWPGKGIEERSDIALTPVDGPSNSFRSPLISGATGGEWLPHGVGPEMPLDQTAEEDGALVFETGVFAAPLDICGAPVLRVRLSCNRPTGHLIVRMSDVLPDGRATRVTYGVLNLIHRDGLGEPKPISPDEPMDVTVKLIDVAQRFDAGHRMRISLATNAWPLIWPAPDASTLTAELETVSLTLPVLSDGAGEGAQHPFAPPAVPGGFDVTVLEPVGRERTISTDPVTGRTTRTYVKDDGAYRIEESGVEVEAGARQDYWVEKDDPLSAGGTMAVTIEIRRGNWRAGIQSRTTMTSGRDEWRVQSELTAHDGEDLVGTRTIDEAIPRRFS